MTIRIIVASATLVAAFAAGAAVAQDDFKHTLQLRDTSTAELNVTFHSDRETMVACTPAQIASIEQRSIERTSEIVPALNARLMSRKDPPGTVIVVLLDAACYEGDIMGLAGFGRGDEAIQLAYEEATAPDGEWGPPE